MNRNTHNKKNLNLNLQICLPIQAFIRSKVAIWKSESPKLFCRNGVYGMPTFNWLVYKVLLELSDAEIELCYKAPPCMKSLRDYLSRKPACTHPTLCGHQVRHILKLNWKKWRHWFLETRFRLQCLLWNFFYKQLFGSKFSIYYLK